MPERRHRAAVFDIYEALVTEFDPDWQVDRTPAQRLGVRTRRDSAVRLCLTDHCVAAGRTVDRSTLAIERAGVGDELPIVRLGPRASAADRSAAR